LSGIEKKGPCKKSWGKKRLRNKSEYFVNRGTQGANWPKSKPSIFLPPEKEGGNLKITKPENSPSEGNPGKRILQSKEKPRSSEGSRFLVGSEKTKVK